MKISKHLHSCLLVTEQNTTVLIDPGIFTYNAKALDLTTITHLDYLLFTHEHSDHFHLPFVQEIVQKFPDVKIVTHPQIVDILATENIKATSEENEIVKFELLTHEKLWDQEPLQNAVFTIFNKLTHPGDSLHFTQQSDILALPLTAPWGSTTEAVNKALEIKPKVIIPIHDWMWKDDVRAAMYTRLTEFFTTKNIQFQGLETGEVFEQ